MSDLFFRQLLSGRDFALDDPMAAQMMNHVYVIGDTDSGEAVLVDPAYDPAGLVKIVEEADLTLTGVLVTHFHFDHCGGSYAGHDVPGIADLLDVVNVPIHVQADEVPWIERMTGVSDELVSHKSGDVVSVGDHDISLIHTPGHTPGSQCFLVDGRLVAGDTLFLEGCGRTDLPGSDPAEMYRSLTDRLAKVPDDTVLFPGHRYSMASSATMALTRETNYVFKPKSLDEWLTAFGG